MGPAKSSSAVDGAAAAVLALQSSSSKQQATPACLRMKGCLQTTCCTRTVFTAADQVTLHSLPDSFATTPENIQQLV